MPDNPVTVAEQIQADFDRLEADLAAQPGVLDVLAVAGEYEAGVKLAEEYLSRLSSPRETFFSTDNSTSQRR